MRKSILMKKPALILITAAVPVLACAPDPGPPLAELRAGVAERPLVHASSTRIPVEWKSLGELDLPSPSPYLFVHIAEGDGNVLRTFDREMPSASAQLEYIEIWQSALAEPLPSGSYRLITGLYDVATGRQWQVETNGTQIDDGKYEIAVIEVETAERKTPGLGFEGEWFPPEAGQKHNPGRRWLGKGGAIRLQEHAGWSELVLAISMTALPADRHRLVMEEANEPQLVIRNGCEADSGDQSLGDASDGDDQDPGDAGDGDDLGLGDGASEIRITGYGLHSASLRLGARGECSIFLGPNFVMLDLEDFTIRSVGLESAFFRPSRDQGD